MPIQIQLHADIFEKEWQSLSLINRLKFFVAKHTFKKATNIRTVSYVMMNELNRLNLKKSTKIFVTPVPLNLDSNEMIGYLSNRPMSIGILSRLHFERNLKEALVIIKKINEINSDFKVVVAGTGELEDWFKSSLTSILGNARVNFLGEIKAEEMEAFWSQVGILLSTAKSETYGRALRESLCHGIPVVCFNTKASTDLKNLDLNLPLIILDSEMISLQTAANILDITKRETTNSYLAHYSEEKHRNQMILMESWSNLFENR